MEIEVPIPMEWNDLLYISRLQKNLCDLIHGNPLSFPEEAEELYNLPDPSIWENEDEYLVKLSLHSNSVRAILEAYVQDEIVKEALEK